MQLRIPQPRDHRPPHGGLDLARRDAPAGGARGAAVEETGANIVAIAPAPGIFVLHDGMGLVAKRLEHVPMSDPPRLRILSDNARYTPYECLAEEVKVIGHIRWFARQL